jgi:tetratricopeptide (TPR) repeat protein
MRLLIAMLVLALAGPAHADPAADKEAREHYTQGQKLFDAADYDAALAQFQRAYELTPYPAILYHIALCHDQLGHAHEALDAYKAYLVVDPKTSRRKGIEARIEKLQSPSPAPPPPAPVEPPAPAPATAPAPAEPAPSAALTATAPPPAHTPVYKKWWLWTVVGVVVAGAVVGGALAATLPKDAPQPSGAIPIHFLLGSP